MLPIEIDLQLFRETDPSKLPNFICIGLAKCASTWLHRVLVEHPAIDMPENPLPGLALKKDFCFWDEKRMDTDLYLSAFSKLSVNLKGESSSGYCASGKTLERIRAALPNVKIIVGFRNPSLVLESAYFHQVRNSGSNSGFKDWVLDYWPRYSEHLNLNRLMNDLSRFDEGRVFHYFYEDVLSKSHVVAKRVYRFLEVDEMFQAPAIEQRINARYIFRHRRLHIANQLLLMNIYDKARMRHMINMPGERPGWVDLLLKMNQSVETRLTVDEHKLAKELTFETSCLFARKYGKESEWGYR